MQFINYLHVVDWLVFAAVLLATIVAVYYGQKKFKTNSIAEYLLMGRKLSLPLFVATLVATWYGGILGVTQIAFTNGIYNFFTQGVFWYLSYIIFALFLVKKIRSYKVATLPELIDKLYGPNAKILSAVIIFIKTLPIVYAISIGLIIQIFVPMPLFLATIIGCSMVIMYSFFGGLRAIVISDAIQFFAMCLGVFLVLVFSICNFGGFEFLTSNLPAYYFSIVGKSNIANMLIWLFIAISTTFINPSFYQRCFAAKTDKTAILGILIATLIWLGFDICTTFGAMYAKAVMPDADPVHAYLLYGLKILPTGCRGLLLASIVATILSTLDSFLFIASNIIAYDLKLFSRKNTIFNKSLMHKHVSSLLLTASITCIFTLFSDGNIEKAWLTLKGLFSACLLVPLLWGYIWSNCLSDKQFIITTIITAIAFIIYNFYVAIAVSLILLVQFTFINLWKKHTV